MFREKPFLTVIDRISACKSSTVPEAQRMCNNKNGEDHKDILNRAEQTLLTTKV